MTHPDLAILEILRHGEITIEGEFLWGSNYTFLVNVVRGESTLKGVYKPTRGEQPLWDFPRASLAKRETAAYLVSEALGWRLVPPTLYRRKAPLGAGSLQLYIEHDVEYHYFSFKEVDLQRLRPAVVFDCLVNNADRKASHVMVDADNHLWLIDHGICFHVEDKLRTVIWDFVDQVIPLDLCSDLTSFAGRLASTPDGPSALARQLAEYLTPGELRALENRARRLAEEGKFPAPDPNRRPYPWPQL